MKAMILAAGLGERMRPLSGENPKPLQPLYDKPLIVHQIERLVHANIKDIVINVSYQANKIMAALGNGQTWGVNIIYSVEPEILGTGGGVIQALSHFNGEAFILTSADVWHDYDFKKLVLPDASLGHLIFVNNPEHHSKGDYHLAHNGQVTLAKQARLTYGNIALLHPALFSDWPAGNRGIGIIFEKAIAAGQVTGTHHQGQWRNVDTPERLQSLETLDVCLKVTIQH